MTRERRRFWIALVCGVGLSGATAFASGAFKDNLVFFGAPFDSLVYAARQHQVIRRSGLTPEGSLHHVESNGDPVAQFPITDGRASIPVRYVRMLPDLLRAGEGSVAIGEMRADSLFKATEVLAEHDETYVPRGIAPAPDKSGRWNPSAGSPPSAATWSMLMPKEKGLG